MSLKDTGAGQAGLLGIGDETMADVIFCDFAGTRKITRIDYLRSAESNVLAAIERPDLRRPFLRLAGQRLAEAEAVRKLMEGAG